jgi:hypothetical protein
MVETTAKVKALTPIDVGPIKIEVEIVNRFIPIVLVDGGSGLNIKPLSTMEKSNLQAMNPSPLSLIWHNKVTKF